MDQLTLLRRVHEESRPSEAAINEGRAALFAAVESGTSSHPPRAARRRVRIAGLGALAAGALTVALVLSNVVGLAGWRGSADAAAAAVLTDAAHAVARTADPVVGAGQFLRVDTTSVGTAFGESVDRVEGDYQYRDHGTLYIPADQSDEWTWVRYPSSLEATFGPRSEAVVANGAFTSTSVEVLRAKNAQFYGSRNTFEPDGWPRDPYLLLNRIYLSTVGTGPSPDGEALVFIADALRDGTVPADLRSAMLEAAAMIPGVTITDDEATLNGQLGVAIGRFEDGWGSRQEVIVDPVTGLLIGEREVLVTADPGSEIPVGTVLRWSSISTEVVDEVPAG